MLSLSFDERQKIEWQEKSCGNILLYRLMEFIYFVSSALADALFTTSVVAFPPFL